MLKTIYQIGKSLGGSRTQWDDIMDNPVSPKDQEKKQYIVPIEFNLDTGEARFRHDEVSAFSASNLVALRSIKIQGGNNKAFYITIPPAKQDQLMKSLFGKVNDNGEFPPVGELIGVIETIASELKESLLYKVLTEIPKCRPSFMALIQDDNSGISLVKAVSREYNKNEVVVLVTTHVTSESLGLNNAFIGSLEGYTHLIEKKFFTKHAVSDAKNKQICYATGELLTDVKEAEFSDRYNINKFFVKTTLNFANNFESDNYAKNYQLSSAVETALDRGSKQLLDQAIVKIAGVRHIIIPEFLNQDDIDLPIRLKATSELLFDRASREHIFAQDDNAETHDFYWINYIAVDSDGNYFKVGNQIKDISKLHLENIISAFQTTDKLLSPWLGKYAFNLYSVYKSIPIRDEKQKNAALHIFKQLMEQRKIDKRILMEHFTALILCHWHQRYRAYSNIDSTSPDFFDIAARDAVFKYLAFIHTLNQLDLIQPTIKTQLMEEGKPTIAQEEEAFFKAMNYTSEQRALFHLGRALHRLVGEQNQKGHKKNTLDKLNYNGMDKHAIYRFANELFESSRHYGISEKIAWNWGAFSRLFNLNDWAMNPQEALFYILSGYTYLIKSKAQEETNSNENQD